MLISLRRAVVVAGLLAGWAGASGQGELAGTWKINIAKSNFPRDLLHFTAGEGGAIRLESGGEGYAFKTDGTPVDRPKSKVVMTWTMESEMHYTTHFSYHFKELKSTAFAISADNKTMTETDSSTPDVPNPKVRNYERVGVGQGLPGDWRNLEDQAQHATYGYRITDNGDGLVKLETTTWTGAGGMDTEATLAIRADGKEVKPTGPKVSKGITVALVKMGPRSYQVTQKLGGKPRSQSTFLLSEDGKTLTETVRDEGMKEPDVAVYDKQ